MAEVHDGGITTPRNNGGVGGGSVIWSENRTPRCGRREMAVHSESWTVAVGAGLTSASGKVAVGGDAGVSGSCTGVVVV